MKRSRDRRITGILAYGSLIHPEEFSQKNILRSVPVKISGFKRVFNQQPTWRKGEGSRIAVLNVETSPVHSINAVCLCFETEHFKDLYSRENGYTLEAVGSERIECYPGHELPIEIDCYLFTGNPEMKRADTLPNSEYLKICLEGASVWGEEFYSAFVATTFLADGTALSDYLSVD